jgi:hypothetical protein
MPEDAVGTFLKRYAYKSKMAQDLQVIPARHGTATFVPSGSTIKIVNTSGTQVIDTWAFALPTPPQKRDKEEDSKNKEQQDQKRSSGGAEKNDAAPAKKEVEQQKPKAVEQPKATPKKGGKKSKDMDLPSQEEAEQATQQFHAQQEAEAQKESADGVTPKKSTWSSYVPSLGLSRSTNKQSDDEKKAETKENSRSWGQYFSAGQSFSSYIPAKDTISAFASSVSYTKSCTF